VVFFKQAGQLIERSEKAVLVWTILGLAIIGFVQVFTRYLFNYSFTWYEELGRYLGVFVTFLGASIGVKSGSHFAMELFVSKMPAPWQNRHRAAISFLSGMFFFLVTWYSWKIVSRMYGYGTTSPTMEIPMYIAYLPIPFFSTLMGFRYFATGVRFLCVGRLSVKNGAEDSQ
jgi:C4-dicarboxylate transporter DctQ subunit